MPHTVAVTGASGFLASELIAQLLARGDNVRGTVRSLADTSKTSHLNALAGAAERLQLFEADLLGGAAAFTDVFSGCSIVYHTACPFVVTARAATLGLDYFVEPAVRGTVAVLEAAASVPTVTRVVMTSSTAAIFRRIVPEGHVYSERDWNDVTELAERKMWYSIAKTKQERAAWAFIDERKPSWSLVCINPTMIAGAARQRVLNASLENVANLANGSSPSVANMNMPWVHVCDVAEAHIAAAHTPSASGRYMMIASWVPLTESAQIISDLKIAGLIVPTAIPADAVPAPLASYDSSRVERELLGGRKLRGLEECMRDSLSSLIAHGHLPATAAAT